MNRSDTEKKVNMRAWKDPEFRKKLIKNPQEALKEFGVENIPAFVNIKIVEEPKNEWTIVLHTPPPNVKNLSEEEMQNLAAGSEWLFCS